MKVRRNNQNTQVKNGYKRWNIKMWIKILYCIVHKNCKYKKEDCHTIQ